MVVEPETRNKTESSKTKKPNKKDESVIRSKCKDWSLNIEENSEEKKCFWWNKTYSISIWETNLKTIPQSTDLAAVRKVTDDHVWAAFIQYQITSVYKVCPICREPEQNIDTKLCCYCSSTVHVECSIPAEPENIAWKNGNKGYEKYMVICFDCEDLKDKPKRVFNPEPDNARRAALRALVSSSEYPESSTKELLKLCSEMSKFFGEDGSKTKEVKDEINNQYMEKVRDIVTEYFQPGNTLSLVTKKPIETKCGGIGVVAVEKIPRFTIIGVYPGYPDDLSGEHAGLGRPGPKYSLVDLNCADFYNNVFTELSRTVTPFINEPNTTEKSNTAWIQETCKPEGRLSVMTVRDIEPGEELLIGYGPLYPRSYPYNYDAYAYHLVEGHDDPPCFALWHWSSVDEKDATFVCYVGYNADTQKYSYWETEDEAKEKEKKECEGSSEVNYACVSTKDL
eukprot:Tbor_TRINITY_DN4953_c2_g7::TRINITY_DN4953_c2_g7_i1::g.9792::m.9792